jgi:hypothetical protein
MCRVDGFILIRMIVVAQYGVTEEEIRIVEKL